LRRLEAPVDHSFAQDEPLGKSRRSDLQPSHQAVAAPARKASTGPVVAKANRWPRSNHRSAKTLRRAADDPTGAAAPAPSTHTKRHDGPRLKLNQERAFPCEQAMNSA